MILLSMEVQFQRGVELQKLQAEEEHHVLETTKSQEIFANLPATSAFLTSFSKAPLNPYILAVSTRPGPLQRYFHQVHFLVCTEHPKCFSDKGPERFLERVKSSFHLQVADYHMHTIRRGKHMALSQHTSGYILLCCILLLCGEIEKEKKNHRCGSV